MIYKEKPEFESVTSKSTLMDSSKSPAYPHKAVPAVLRAAEAWTYVNPKITLYLLLAQTSIFKKVKVILKFNYLNWGSLIKISKYLPDSIMSRNSY